jgi:hypothetical protein
VGRDHRPPLALKLLRDCQDGVCGKHCGSFCACSGVQADIEKMFCVGDILLLSVLLFPPNEMPVLTGAGNIFLVRWCTLLLFKVTILFNDQLQNA